MTLTVYIAFALLFVNIPFGYWRGNTRKFSLAWFASIHIPVVISIFSRQMAGIEFHMVNIFLFVGVFMAGQWWGKFIYVKAKK